MPRRGTAAVIVLGLVVVFGASYVLGQHLGSRAGAAVPLSAFDASSEEGASIPGMTEYQAYGASAATTGALVGPDYAQGALATEAVGREAIQLTAPGQYVQFTLTAPANAIDVHYALKQGASGRLSVYVDGTKLSQSLSLTSEYSYISTPDIAGSMTHHFFNDARMLLGKDLPAGATVKLQVDSGDTAVPYTIDVADFFQVAAPLSQPAGTISVVSEGADPTGVSDSSAAFAKAVSAAATAGETVWVPQGTYTVGTPLQIPSGTLAGAGSWYTVIKANQLIDNPTTSVPGPVNLSGFMIQGSTIGGHDDSSMNAINGSLGTGGTVSGLWIQNTNVGLWMQGASSGVTVKNTIIFDTSEDGLNLNGGAVDDTITNNFVRNTGDDALAVWSLYSADTGDTFSYNTIEQPNLANGIALYGGAGDTVTNNVVADSNALGSGIAISNEAFNSGSFTPLGGTTTVSNNTLLRTGAYNPNWRHPMGAIRIDSYNDAITNPINLTNTTIIDSPYSAIELVSGNGSGLGISGLTIEGADVEGVGTVVFQAETTGSAHVSGVSASDVGVPGAYNYSFPGDKAGAFSFNVGSGNSGWSATPALKAFPKAVAPTDSPTAGSSGAAATGNASPSAAPSQAATTAAPATSSAAGNGAPVTASTSANANAGTNGGGGGSGGSYPDLAYRQPVTASGYAQSYVPTNAVDGNADSYWESTDDALPQWFQVDLGQSYQLAGLTLQVPPLSSWGIRTQTITVLGSADGNSFNTLLGPAAYTFDPASGNAVAITLPDSATARYVRLVFTANTGWQAGQVSELDAYSTASGMPPRQLGDGGSGNLALGMPATASGSTETYQPGDAVDGDQSSYWESTDNALPQWWQVDLGSVQTVGRVVMCLPDLADWGTRTQSIAIGASTDGTNFTVLAAAVAYRFSTGTNANCVSVSTGQAKTRYLRLVFTANTGWPAGQLSGFQAYES
jgi:hypothetical protein